MENLTYLMNYEEYKNYSLKNLINKINNNTKLSLNKLIIDNLIFIKNNPIKIGNGVYFFFDNDESFYIGKAQARSFVERIPAHFDIREKESSGWGFNTCLKKMLEKRISNSFEEAAKRLLKMKLFLINFQEQDNLDKCCRPLEKLFRYLIPPSINPISGKQIKILDRKMNQEMSIEENISILQNT